MRRTVAARRAAAIRSAYTDLSINLFTLCTFAQSSRWLFGRGRRVPNSHSIVVVVLLVVGISSPASENP